MGKSLVRCGSILSSNGNGTTSFQVDFLRSFMVRIIKKEGFLNAKFCLVWFRLVLLAYQPRSLHIG